MCEIVESESSLTTAYLHLEEYRFLSNLLEITIEGIANFVYYEALKKFNSSNPWIVHTKNAHHTALIVNWNKLFGAKPYKSSNGEPTHYHKLLDFTNLHTKLIEIGIDPLDSKSLKKRLLCSAKLEEEKFNDCWEKMNSYRNGYLIHREMERKLEHPSIDCISTAIKSLEGLHAILLEILDKFPNSTNEKWKTDYHAEYYCLTYRNINAKQLKKVFLSFFIVDYLSGA